MGSSHVLAPVLLGLAIAALLLARHLHLRRVGMTARFADSTPRVPCLLFTRTRVLVGLALTLAFTVLGAAAAWLLVRILFAATLGDWGGDDTFYRFVILLPPSLFASGALTGFLLDRFTGACWPALCIPTALWCIGLGCVLGMGMLYCLAGALAGTFLGARMHRRRARKDPI